MVWGNRFSCEWKVVAHRNNGWGLNGMYCFRNSGVSFLQSHTHTHVHRRSLTVLSVVDSHLHIHTDTRTLVYRYGLIEMACTGQQCQANLPLQTVSYRKVKLLKITFLPLDPLEFGSTWSYAGFDLIWMPLSPPHTHTHAKMETWSADLSNGRWYSSKTKYSGHASLRI